jgi:hypothetical protein
MNSERGCEAALLFFYYRSLGTTDRRRAQWTVLARRACHVKNAEAFFKKGE